MRNFPAPIPCLPVYLSCLIVLISFLHAEAGNSAPHEPRIDLAAVPGNATCHHIITEPGTYFLSRNLEVTKATGVNIQASGVTLDLNGFQVRRTSKPDGHGILIAVSADDCKVQDGAVSGFAYGVRAFSEGGSYIRLTASHCAFAGLVGGTRWTIEDCQVFENPEIGICSGDGSIIVTRYPATTPTRKTTGDRSRIRGL